MRYITFFLLALAVCGHAQTLSKYKSWQLLDYQQDGVYGTSVNRVYTELLKGRQSHPVIVAVIDEGVDIDHPDLRGHIWTNPKEVAGNGIDDDKNGYADDVHGWNFLGGRDGRNIYATSSEADREYARLLPEFAGRDSASASGQKDYAYFQTVRKEHIVDSVGRNRDIPALIKPYMRKIEVFDSLLRKATGKEKNYYADIVTFQPPDSLQMATKKSVLGFFNSRKYIWEGISLDSTVRNGRDAIKEAEANRLLYAQVEGADPLKQRREIVGDDPSDITDRHYGNPIVGDEHADHGSHCACIIAANRNDGSGMDGVADKVIVLPVRAINALRYGDEMDKDVSLAIRYAVDNGARIISMSFGKDMSPQRPWVEEAIRYAEKKGVLLVHAAGNDGRNIDSSAFFPTPFFQNGHGRANNFINVGSISSDTGTALPAGDSDYGQDQVDLFAPGVNIYSCIPGGRYAYMSGTSMATPVVAGIAALLLEYHPQLTAAQVKDILMRSVTSLKGKLVYRPGSKEKVDFATLCVSGGVVNAYKAMQLADELSSK